MKFLRFDPALCAFPKARLSPLPGRLELTLRPNRRAAGALPKPPAQLRHYARGRYALSAAYQLAGVGRDGALLAPSYHCVTMLDPALALSAKIALYPLRADLAPDLAQLDAVLAACETPARALLATHFFGFAQDFSPLQAWCEAHDIALIEDCSHVLCTDDFQAPGTGVYGRYVVASPYKFFASEDGGTLYSPHAPLPDALATQPAGLTEELRAIKHLIDMARVGYRSAPAIEALDGELAKLQASRVTTGAEQVVERAQPSAQYCADARRRSSLRSSRTLVGRASTERNAERRRANYLLCLSSLHGVSNCQVLYADLPRDCAPYMFPLRIAYPEPHFYWLKHLGVPVWRWDEMAVSNCPVAQDYRLHLIHLPCHQSLNDEQMRWLLTAVRKTLQHVVPGAL